MTAKAPETVKTAGLWQVFLQNVRRSLTSIGQKNVIIIEMKFQI